jgi:hypothetical protein
VNIPGYDLRRLMLARDPLSAVNVFVVQVRVILATLLGVRVCPDCPHCGMSEHSACRDKYGSNAEVMGGIAGRVDALAGAVECQKVTGSLHLHFWAFVQRVHQYHTMEEIGKMLEKGLIEADDLKRFIEGICCESYPHEDQHLNSIDQIEKNWPKFHEDTDKYTLEETDVASKPPVWGELRYGRLPPFIWEESKDADYSSLYEANAPDDQHAILQDGANAYRRRFNNALQENQMRVQHHIHPKNKKQAK